ncbi:MAG: fasciclin domain-containing protein [Chitinophagales bacterium]
MKFLLNAIAARKLALIGFLFLSTLRLLAQTNVYDDVIAVSPAHTALAAALQQEGLVGALQDPSATLTVFAPTNEAFDNLAAALGTDINGLLALPNLSDILLYHVLGATVPSSAVTNGAIVTPLNASNTIKMTRTSAGAVYANQALVNAADLTTDNGVVHSTAAVLLPVETVVDIAIDNGFTYLTAAVVTAELLPALTDPLAQLTVFAPENAAFDNLAAALGTDINGLLALPNLADVLTYHVLGAEVASSAVTNGLIAQPISTSNTLKFTVTNSNEVFVNQAQVTAVDINADNGIVHVINSVVLPVETVADVAIDNGFSYLTAAVVEARLLPALTNPLAQLTVFAPENAAFDNLAAALGTDINGLLALPNLADVLTYHVLGAEVASSAVTNGLIAQPISTSNTLKFTVTNSNEVFVNQAQVTAVDINADNGIVHVINSVVLPVETVADVAIDNGFTYLTAAVVEARLLPALTNPLAQLTVFAPTNTAFENLAAALGTDISGLLANPALGSILLYHVIGETLLSTELTSGPLTTLNGQAVTISLAGGVTVNNSNVSLADLQVYNGVVHVIDAVLVPGPVSTNNLQVGAVEMYPNPATEMVRFNNLPESNFTIINVQGAIVKEGTTVNSSIQVADLQAGNYFLYLRNENGQFVTKLVKL